MTERLAPAVVVATDENFLLGTAVTLRSLATTTTTATTAFVLHDAVTAAGRARVEASVPDPVTVRWIDCSEQTLSVRRRNHLPDSTYYRLHAADLLPPEVRRYLYLDVDVLVRGPLDELFDVALGRDDVLAAVRSVHYPSVATRGACNGWRTLGLDPRAPYFNAGVLVIDRDRWVDADISAAVHRYLDSDLLGGGADQEALNVTLSGRWHPLRPTYNAQTPAFTDDYGVHLIHDDAEIAELREDPRIVHFQTLPKPWHLGCTHPLAPEWEACAAGTAFAPTTGFRVRSRREELRWRIRRAGHALRRGK